jgi:hypothetical protein
MSRKKRKRTPALSGRFALSQPISRVLSRTIINLGCLSPNTSSSLPKPSAGHTIEFLFGLAPSGVYRAASVASCAVRSYRTFSPLPQKIEGGSFSVALSVRLRVPGVTWRFTLWSPDFPPRYDGAIV